jgi:hypothetical protein
MRRRTERTGGGAGSAKSGGAFARRAARPHGEIFFKAIEWNRKMKNRPNVCSVGFAAIGGFGETCPTFSDVPASRSVGTGLRAVRKVGGSFLPPRSPRSRSRLFSSGHRREQVSIPKGESSFLCGAGVSPAGVSRCMAGETPAPHEICFQSHFRGMLASFRNTHPPTVSPTRYSSVSSVVNFFHPHLSLPTI